MARDWDAQTYDRVADPQARWGRAVLDRLPLAGDERVLDAGCGTGRVTELLAARLPHGHVVALDASAAMIEAAHQRLAPFGERIEYAVADLGQPLPLAEPVDAILSTATFHWIADHDALFAILGAHLDRLPADERDAFVRAVADRLPEPVIDYVRLNIVARGSRRSRH